MKTGSGGEPPEYPAGHGAAASDGRYRAVFLHVPEPVVILDLEARCFEEANEAACQLLGYSSEEFHGLPLATIRVDRPLFGRDPRIVADESFEAALRGESPVFEVPFKRKDGAEVETELHLFRAPPLDRRVIVGILHDVTARNAAQRDIEQREARFRALADNSPDWIVRLDPELRRTYANPAVVSASGIPLEQLLGKRPTESFPGSSEMAGWEDALRRVLETRLPETSEHQVGINGLVWVQVTIVPEMDERGSVISLLSITRDVTSIRRALEAESRLASIVASAQDAIMSSNHEGIIVTWNRAAERMFGLPAHRAIGRTAGFLFGGDDAPERLYIRDRVFSGETVQTPEREVRRRDGTTILVSSVAFPLVAADGSITGMASITRDITEERRAARELAASESHLRLAFQAAHMGSWSFDPATSGVSWSPEIAALYRRTPEEMPPTTEEAGRSFIHPEDREAVGRRRVKPGETSTESREYRVLMPDGSYRWFASIGANMVTDDGRISGVVMDIHERKLAEEAIRESEARFRQVVESVNAGVWVFDGEEIVLVNHALETLTGYSREQLLTPGFFEKFFPADQVAAMRSRGARRIAGEDVESRYEIRVTHADGSERTWELSVSRIDLHGAPASIVSVFDVTHRREIEDALRDSEARFRQVVETVSTGIWTWDNATQTVPLVNRALESITGYPREQLLAPGFLGTLFAPGDLDRLSQITNDVEYLGQPIPPPIEIRMRTANSTWRTLALTASIIRLDGNPVWLSSVVDITERQQSLDALRDSEARFRSLVDNSPDYITRLNRDLRHEFVNATAQHEAGLDPGEVLGKRADEMGFAPELASMFLARQQEVLQTGQPIEYEYTLDTLTEPSQLAHRRARLIPEKDEAGNVHHVLSIVTDITAERTAAEERQRLDRQMQHTQKLESLGVLAGGIAHDFNNLLVAILGNAGLALMELPPESPARQTVESIETAAQRASELTRQMLAYSGRGRFIIEPLNISRVVEEMAHLLAVSVSKRATLKYHFDAALPHIEGDATQVRQVVMNLIINASDALGEPSGVISVSTGTVHADHAYLASAYLDGDLPEGEYVFLEVADTGSGMDEATRAKIFDPFFTTKFTGRGLGLAAVLGIVRGHRGAIKLYSEPGRGTSFKVLFPAVDEGGPVSVTPARTVEDGKAAGRTLLVVDDDDTVRAVTKRILEHIGFSVLVAADGREGADVYAQHRDAISLVLLDMTMPNMDGEETFRELRRLDADVRVVLTSGYNEQDATERFAGKGLAGFIQKPYRPQELLEVINAALGD